MTTDIKYQSTKRYGHEAGFSCAFRQWRATSHCRLIHGYALSFKFVFESDTLDVRNWVVDFGGLKSLKKLLEANFDHKTVVAYDDPHLDYFKEGERLGVLELVILSSTGCEKFAELVFDMATRWLADEGYQDRVTLVSVEVAEHGSNSALAIKA